MAPDDELLEDEERQDAGEQRAENARGWQRLQGLRKQREQGDAEERAHGIAHEPRDHLLADPISEKQQRRCQAQTAEASAQRQTDSGEGWHAAHHRAKEGVGSLFRESLRRKDSRPLSLPVTAWRHTRGAHGP